jgi:hypothetical protein
MMERLWERMIRAAKLDVSLYEEVEADKDALKQATVVVVMSSLAAGVGASSHGGIGALIVGSISALAGWYVWSFLTYWIGTRFLPEPQTNADYGELLRSIGFSSSPGVIRVLGVVPGWTGLVFFAVSIWMLVAMIVAVRQALDYTGAPRAVAVCAIGWIVQVLILAVLYVMYFGVAASA